MRLWQSDTQKPSRCPSLETRGHGAVMPFAKRLQTIANTYEQGVAANVRSNAP
jgi:hypothetical protein